MSRRGTGFVRHKGDIGFERAHLQQFLSREVQAARLSFGFNEKIVLFQMSASLVLKVGLLGFALWLWQQGASGVPKFVMSTTLSFVVIAEARNISRRFLDLFEYIGKSIMELKQLSCPMKSSMTNRRAISRSSVAASRCAT